FTFRKRGAGKSVVDNENIEDAGDHCVNPAEVPCLVAVRLKFIQSLAFPFCGRCGRFVLELMRVHARLSPRFERGALERAKNRPLVVVGIEIVVLPYRRPGGYTDPELTQEFFMIV